MRVRACMSVLASVPGLPRSVRVLIKRMQNFECGRMRLIETRTERGRPGTEAMSVYSDFGLAALLSEKRNKTYGVTMGWLRTHLSYALLWSAILYLRGSRSRRTALASSDCTMDLVHDQRGSNPLLNHRYYTSRNSSARYSIYG